MARVLQDLPLELLYEIVGYLGYAPRLALRMSCRSLRANLDDQVLPKKVSSGTSYRDGKETDYMMDDLLEIELWPEHSNTLSAAASNYFACYVCLRIRSGSKFSNAMMNGKRGKNGKEPETRFCIDCGIKKKKFSPGTEISFGGASGGTGFICFDCRNFVNERSHKDSATDRLCSSCSLEVARGRKSRAVSKRSIRRMYEDEDDWFDEYEIPPQNIEP